MIFYFWKSLGYHILNSLFHISTVHTKQVLAMSRAIHVHFSLPILIVVHSVVSLNTNYCPGTLKPGPPLVWSLPSPCWLTVCYKLHTQKFFCCMMLQQSLLIFNVFKIKLWNDIGINHQCYKHHHRLVILLLPEFKNTITSQYF